MATFQVLELAIQLIAELRPVVSRIQQHDRDLANQLRRSASSIPRNISEAIGRSEEDRIHHFHIAAESAAEARTILLVAQGWAYLEADGSRRAAEPLDRVQAMLWRLTR